MNRTILLLALTMLVFGALPTASAKVTNENTDELPPGCEEIAGERELTVHASREHASEFNGAVFTFDNRSWEIPACTRVTVTFVNEDDIRHQFMVHDTFPDGFFQIEVTGPGQDTGTFITGSSARSLLVHCGVTQHQQKGMKAQILQHGGEGDIPNILGISGIPDQGVGEDGPDDEQPIPSLVVPELLAMLATAGLILHTRRNG